MSDIQWRLTKLRRHIRCYLLGHEWIGIEWIRHGLFECMCCGKRHHGGTR